MALKFTKKNTTQGVEIDEMSAKSDLQEFTVTVIPVEDQPVILVIPKSNTFPDTIVLTRR